MREMHENQALLVAVDFHGFVNVLGFEGDAAEAEVEAAGSNEMSHLGFASDDIPPKEDRGLCVWEGTIGTNEAGGHEAADWHGQWRRAVLADFERFGLPTPE